MTPWAAVAWFAICFSQGLSAAARACGRPRVSRICRTSEQRASILARFSVDTFSIPPQVVYSQLSETNHASGSGMVDSSSRKVRPCRLPVGQLAQLSQLSTSSQLSNRPRGNVDVSCARRHRPIDVDDDEIRTAVRCSEESLGGSHEPLVVQDRFSAFDGRFHA